ncbi:MAG: diguanylate cyclase [Myxococcales bacterium]|nr:diguanylate cyclase [Myxococcales bacterium]
MSERLRDFAQLLTEEEEAADSVGVELRRMSDTAGTLDLEGVSRAARDAAVEIEDGVTSVRVLRRVANALRAVVGQLRFGPVVVVGLTGRPAQLLREDSELICEDVDLFPDLPAFASALHTDEPSAVVLPVEALDAVRQLSSRERFPVLVHGRSAAWLPRLRAMEAGAHGFLLEGFRLADVTRLARWRTSQQRMPFEVVLLADQHAVRDALARSLERAGLVVVTASDPAELAAALQAGVPRAVVLGATVAGQSALSLARMVRGHPWCNHVPLLVWGRPEEPGLLRAVGVDDIVRSEADPDLCAQRVLDRVSRLDALPWERDPVTGMRNRLGVLDAVDAELAKASRSSSVLSLVLVALRGWQQAVETHGVSVARVVRRRLVTVLSDELRRTDIYGELAGGELLVAIPDCRAEVAEQRLRAAGETFAALCAQDRQLAELRFVLGAADTRLGLQGLAQRAERALRIVERP